MFAVPGWSLAPESLKKQDNNTKSASSRVSKRRKTRHDDSTANESTSEKTARKVSRLQSLDDRTAQVSAADRKISINGRSIAEKTKAGRGAKPARNDQRRSRELAKSGSSGSSSGMKGERSARNGNQENAARELQPAPRPAHRFLADQALPPPHYIGDDSMLTPLQKAMRQKLVGAHFRHLNERLYNTTSSEARRLFNEHPKYFEEYHAGFQQQVSSWPQNPVHEFATEILERANEPSTNGQSKRSRAAKISERQHWPLPRSKGTCRIVDLGCGDGQLAKEVRPVGKTLKLEVRSFDLHSTDPVVEIADIADLPLKPESTDIAILCLALMGTNWIEFVEEAWRILQRNGELWVAETKSRFSRTKSHVTSNANDRSNLKAKDKNERGFDETPAVEKSNQASGGAESGETTDVAAFLHVLQQRGFTLENNEAAVDLSNKMFVRMKFVKSPTPTKGKHSSKTSKALGSASDAYRRAMEYEEEKAVLKPCLYKIR